MYSGDMWQYILDHHEVVFFCLEVATNYRFWEQWLMFIEV